LGASGTTGYDARSPFRSRNDVRRGPHRARRGNVGASRSHVTGAMRNRVSLPVPALLRVLAVVLPLLVLAPLATDVHGQTSGTATPSSRVAPRDPSDYPVVVASKPFGESYLLCEMFAQLLEAHGIAVTRRPAWGRRRSRSARSA